MADLVEIIGCKNNKIVKSCKTCIYGKTWDGKGCIQYMKENKMSEILRDVSVSFPHSY